MSFKRCHLSFAYFLLYKELSYVLSRAILEQVARNRAPVSKKNPRNENNQQLSRPWKRFLKPFRAQTRKHQRFCVFCQFSYQSGHYFAQIDFQMQTHAHYPRDSIALLRMWMEIHNWEAVSCCEYFSVSWFFCITCKIGVKFISKVNVSRISIIQS